MQTLSSAKRTCIASASAVECTATVGMPSSLQARRTRSAISPRLAIRILSNMATVRKANSELGVSHYSPFATHYSLLASSFNDHQRFAEFDRLAVLEQNLDHGAAPRRRNLIHGFHRFDDQQRVAGFHRAADLDKGLGARLRRGVSGADHRRDDDARMLGWIEWRRDGFCVRLRGGRRSRTRRHGRRCRHHAARDANALPVLLDLDLGQAGIIKKLAQLLN